MICSPCQILSGGSNWGTWDGQVMLHAWGGGKRNSHGILVGKSKERGCLALWSPRLNGRVTT